MHKFLSVDLSKLYGGTTDILNGPKVREIILALASKDAIVFPDTEGNKHTVIIDVVSYGGGREATFIATLKGTTNKSGQTEKKDSSIMGIMRIDGWGYFKTFKEK